MRLILASKSPARLQTLRNAGLNPEVVVSDVDESGFTAPTPAALAARLAEAKAEAVFSTLAEPSDTIIIGCDSILDFNGEPIGKPGTPAAAIALLKRTNGHSGTLVTGHHIIVSRTPNSDSQPHTPGVQPHTPDIQPHTPDIHPPTPTIQRRTAVASTEVHLATLTNEEIEAYVATGEPTQVAGGFTIDGLGGPFISRVNGDHHNVVGISLPLLRLMLAEVAIGWPTLWSQEAE